PQPKPKPEPKPKSKSKRRHRRKGMHRPQQWGRFFLFRYWTHFGPASRSIQKAPDFIGAPYGVRTRVFAVKGRCPRPLDEGRKSAATTSCSGLALKQVAGV